MPTLLLPMCRPLLNTMPMHTACGRCVDTSHHLPHRRPPSTGKFEDPHTLLGLLQHAMSDAWLSLGLALRLNVLPLTRQLAMLSGSLWGKALQGQRAGRIEMLLLHELHARKFMLPDKLSNRERDARKAAEGDGEDDGADGQGGRRKAAYAGGLVLEPKRGLYDKYVLLLDFNSLYPSIIQEYNIDFSTVARPDDDSVPALPETSEELATLPRVIQTLVQRRRQVKALLKDEKDPVRGGWGVCVCAAPCGWCGVGVLGDVPCKNQHGVLQQRVAMHIPHRTVVASLTSASRRSS